MKSLNGLFPRQDESHRKWIAVGRDYFRISEEARRWQFANMNLSPCDLSNCGHAAMSYSARATPHFFSARAIISARPRRAFVFCGPAGTHSAALELYSASKGKQKAKR